MKRIGWAVLLGGCLWLVGSNRAMTAAQTQVAETPTFTKDVLPILQQNCQSCHRPGQIGTFSMLTYEGTRPWARSIKQRVVSRQMPPWFADHPETFANDRTLKQQDIDTIAKWVDAGAPQGDPKDAPKAVAWATDGWQTTPDLIVRLPEFRVPARPPKNVIEWVTVTLPSGFTKDTWVTSLEVKPSDLSVTHHICLTFVPHRDDVKYYEMTWKESPRDGEGVATDQGATAAPTVANPPANDMGGFGCYVPGAQADDYRPFNAAKLIRAGADIEIQLHYTPTGKETVDRPLMGFTVTDTPPEKRWISYSLSGAGPQFKIPPHEGNYQSPPAQAIFEADAWMVQMMPHMHVRGKSMKYKLIFPDKREQVVLNVPKYDFNWQLIYQPSKPIFIPKGTLLYVDATFDNSTANKFNPNPNQTVYAGRMTWEEMMAPFFGVIVDGKTDPNKVLKPLRGTVLGDGA